MNTLIDALLEHSSLQVHTEETSRQWIATCGNDKRELTQNKTDEEDRNQYDLNDSIPKRKQQGNWRRQIVSSETSRQQVWKQVVTDLQSKLFDSINLAALIMPVYPYKMVLY